VGEGLVPPRCSLRSCGGYEIAEWDAWGRSFRAAGPTAPPLPAATQLERSPYSPDMKGEKKLI